MRILIACEYSGIVRDAFRMRGHDAVSCDLLPTESDGPHYQCDVSEVIDLGWDMMIAHPPCTYLTNSGVRHLHSVPSGNGTLPRIHGEKRIEALKCGAEFFLSLFNANIPKICIENPIPHKYAVSMIGRKYDQIVHPWQFGNTESKSICLWLKKLPPLMYVLIEQKFNVTHGIHRMSPSVNRSHERSRFFPEIAKAMAEQWG